MNGISVGIHQENVKLQKLKLQESTRIKEELK